MSLASRIFILPAYGKLFSSSETVYCGQFNFKSTCCRQGRSLGLEQYDFPKALREWHVGYVSRNDLKKTMYRKGKSQTFLMLDCTVHYFQQFALASPVEHSFSRATLYRIAKEFETR